MAIEKRITPSKEGRRIVGYIGELLDGETVISSLEYSTHHAAEVALDALAFDILSDLATEVPADELPAFAPTTCVYCHKSHHPADCPEMRKMLFAPLDVDYAPIGPEV